MDSSHAAGNLTPTFGIETSFQVSTLVLSIAKSSERGAGPSTSYGCRAMTWISVSSIENATARARCITLA